MSKPVVLSETSAPKVKELIRKLYPHGERGGGATSRDFSNPLVFVKVGTSTSVSGVYNGTIMSYDGTDYEDIDDTDVYVRSSGVVLQEDTIITAVCVGEKAIGGTTKPILKMVAGEIEVGDYDATQTPNAWVNTGIHRLNVDRANGLRWGNPVDGIAQLHTDNAHPSIRAGMITNAAQEIGGRKKFFDGLQVKCDNGFGYLVWDETNEHFRLSNSDQDSHMSAAFVVCRFDGTTVGQLGIYEHTGVAGEWTRLRVFNGDGSDSRVGQTSTVYGLDFKGGIFTGGTIISGFTGSVP